MAAEFRVYLTHRKLLACALDQIADPVLRQAVEAQPDRFPTVYACGDDPDETERSHPTDGVTVCFRVETA